MPDVKGRWTTTITVPANTRGFKIRAPFVPDWWRVSLAETVTGSLQVYPGSLAVIGGVPLTGTGQWSFPAEGDTDDSIIVDNHNVGEAKLAIYASRGFPPDSYVPPVTLAGFGTVVVASRTGYWVTGFGGATSFSFSHPHPYSEMLVLATILSTTQGVGSVPSITQLLAGGEPLGLRASDNKQQGGGAGFRSSHTSIWAATGLGTGQKSMSITTAAGVDAMLISVLTLAPPVSFGATFVENYEVTGVLLATRNYDVVATGSKSSSFGQSLGSAFGGGVPTFTEINNSVLLDSKDYSPSSQYARAHRRNGGGIQRFTYQLSSPAAASNLMVGCACAMDYPS